MLITGSKGFVGKHLSSLFEGEVLHYNLRDGQDLLDYEQLRNFLDAERPDYIYHLAAQAFVGESFTNPRRSIEVNTLGSLNLLEAVRQLGIKPKILLAGTSEEYGNGDVTETSMLAPLSPYAISKVAMDYLGQLYAKAYGMHVVVTRTFNHTGPGRGEMYAESSFAKQIALIEKGELKELRYGNLLSVRNYTDVRDVVKAYKLAIDLPSGVYNICSDTNINLEEVLDKLISLARTEIVTKQDEALIRPVDFSFKLPNCDKFKSLTTWQPQYTIDKTLSYLLDYWRAY